MDHSSGILANLSATLSGRYARALFALTQEGEDRERSGIAPVERDLDTLEAAIADSGDFDTLLASPLIDRANKADAVAALARSIKLSPLTAQFLGVLAVNGRLAALPTIIRDFKALAADARGELRAEVTSAHPLSAAQTEALAARLKARMGRDVLIDCAVDREMLGGLKVQIGSELIDGSLRTQLNTLAHAMKG